MGHGLCLLNQYDQTNTLLNIYEPDARLGNQKAVPAFKLLPGK